jgi:hypothetical protein
MSDRRSDTFGACLSDSGDTDATDPKGDILARSCRPKLDGLEPPKKIASPFEFWSEPVFYTPYFLYWLFQGVRHGSLTLPTAANPRMEFGGMCGDSKSHLWEQISGEARERLAPYVVGMRRAGARPTEEARRLLAVVRKRGLDFPLVAKPDIGSHGAGVRVVRNVEQLGAYLSSFPEDTKLLLQEYVSSEGEAGIFYVRRPPHFEGEIFSLTLKFSPYVMGDGRSTLKSLITSHPRFGLAPRIFLDRHKEKLEEIPLPGESVRLAFTNNHSQGAICRDGERYITPELTSRIHAVAQTIPDFNFGRFDCRFNTLKELQAGKGFAIVEINGGGSQATHIWDPDTSLTKAYGDLFRQVKLLFEIGAANRTHGHKSWSFWELMQSWRRERRLLRSYPTSD